MQENIKLTAGILYRQQIVKNATTLLDQLLNSTWLNALNEEIIILVIGAGTFPSFEFLLNKLSHIKNIKFTLVDISKNATDFFQLNFAKQISTISSQVTFEVYNLCIKEFLQTSKNSYDLIYFEHPETMSLPLILNKIGFKQFAHHITFRESFPLLNNVLKLNTLIFASCMSRHELNQLRNLLQFSLQGSACLHFSKNPIHLFYGGPYSSGLSFQIIQQKKNILSLTKKIKNSDNLLCLFVLASLILYFLQSPYESFSIQLGCLFLVGAQLFFHTPDRKGLLIKCGLLGMQWFL